jgi:hypothetical protein
MNPAANYTPQPKARRPLPVPTPIRNPILLGLLWLSKSDTRLLALCGRWAIATQTAFGVFVLFTAALAFGAAYYTLSTLNAPASLVPWVAFGWSAFILFLDREIAGSLDRTTAIVRPFLALFVGTLVAIPIELWIFQGRVDQELQRIYRQDNKQQLDDLHAMQSKMDKRRDDMEATLGELRKQEADWAKVLDSEAVGRVGPGRTGIPGAGPAFQNAQTQQASVRQSIQETRRDLEQLQASIPYERKRLEGQFQREEVGTTTDFVTRYEAMDRVVHDSDPLYRLSWLITLALIFVEMTVALLKILTPHVDYHHLVQAEIRENCARIDELSDRNYRLAMENPEIPRLSVAEKFAIVKYTPVPRDNSFASRYESKSQA